MTTGVAVTGGRMPETAVRRAVTRVVVWVLVAVFVGLSLAHWVAMPDGGYWILSAWSGNAVVGALLLTHRARSRIGACLLAFALYWAVSGILYLPGVAPSIPVWLELLVAATASVWLLVPLIVLLYPEDRIRSRTGRVLATVIVVVGGVLFVAQLVDSGPLEATGRVSPWAVPALAPLTAALLRSTTFILVAILATAALVELVLRWRRARGAQRLQFRWFAYGTAVTVAVLVLASLVPRLPAWVSLPLILCFNAIPVTVFIALTRHGLYGIDRVISRTLTYAIVTAVAVGVYLALATSITLVIPGAPAVGVAAATLAAAAVFLPLLRRVQRRLDRRFDRERYDAAATVEAFGARLRGRLDPSGTIDDLVEVVDRSLQPVAVGVWTAGGAR